MKKTLIYQEFEKLAEQLEIRLVIGKGSFNGDYCLVEEDKYIVINKNKPIEHKIKRLASAFSKLNLSDIYVKPAIRELIETEKSQTLF